MSNIMWQILFLIIADMSKKGLSDQSRNESTGSEIHLAETSATAATSSQIDSSAIIYILGLFELSEKNSADKYEESPKGMSELAAARLAVEHVNRIGLLGNYSLQLLANDTKCDPGVAVDTFFHTIFSRDIRVPIVLGSSCSGATESLASVVPYWNTVQISHGATSPVLQDRKQFPTFYRVVASDSSRNGARLSLIQHFDWHTVSIISQNRKEHTLAVNDLVKKLEDVNITCKTTLTFGESDFQDQLLILKESDSRIIIGSFSSEIAPKVFCKVFEMGMFGTEYAWILAGEEKSHWWLNNGPCSTENLLKATQGALFIGTYQEGGTTDLNFSEEDLKHHLLREHLPMEQFVLESYDAVWTAALAINKTLHNHKKFMNYAKLPYCRFKCAESNDSGTQTDIAAGVFKEIASLKFTGLSGPIVFEGADRIGSSAFMQLQGDNLVTVGLFSPSSGLNLSCDACEMFLWGDDVPVAQRYIQVRVETISSSVFITVSTFTTVAVLLSFLFLGFNLYFRKLKFIKLSSPRLNNMAVVGCIAVYIGVMVLGLDNATNPAPHYFEIFCTAKIYLFAGGFSLAFGSVFAKTYRIRKIFIRSRGGFFKKKFLQDTQLILLVCALLLVDGLLITVWVAIDPMERQLRNLTLQVSTSDRSVIYLPQLEVCSCSYLHGWLSLLYAYKGLQLVIGVYMAWETRHVKIPALNDSQYIGMSVYGVVITSCIVVVLANVVAERPSMAYAIISTMILTTTTATLSLLFLPKVVAVIGRKHLSDPVMHSMGLKLESNTRRFLTDDSKEKLFRLEVQNRVFKRELVLLTTEQRRLERLLAMTGSPNESTMSLEIASYKVSPKDTELSEPYTIFGTPSYQVRERSIPRSSWPSETRGPAKGDKATPFRSDPHLGGQPEHNKVLHRIRNLIRSKRMELRKMANSGEIYEENKRKFSLAACIQNQRPSKEIIIDLGVSSDEVHRTHSKSKDDPNWRRRRLQHQRSQPIIFLNLQKSSPSANHRLFPAVSMSALEESKKVTFLTDTDAKEDKESSNDEDSIN